MQTVNICLITLQAFRCHKNWKVSCDDFHVFSMDDRSLHAYSSHNLALSLSLVVLSAEEVWHKTTVLDPEHNKCALHKNVSGKTKRACVQWRMLIITNEVKKTNEWDEWTALHGIYDNLWPRQKNSAGRIFSDLLFCATVVARCDSVLFALPITSQLPVVIASVRISFFLPKFLFSTQWLDAHKTRRENAQHSAELYA